MANVGTMVAGVEQKAMHWEVASGQWRVASGTRSVALLATGHRPLDTGHCAAGQLDFNTPAKGKVKGIVAATDTD